MTKKKQSRNKEIRELLNFDDWVKGSDPCREESECGWYLCLETLEKLEQEGRIKIVIYGSRWD